MTYVDDVRAAQSRVLTARADLDKLQQAAVDVVYARLRPVAAFNWMDDALLRRACEQFVYSATYDTLNPDARTPDAPPATGMPA
jgi:hypothetical protein